MNKKIVIVSGGCGGIGRYVTQGLLSDGHKVILVGRNEKNYHDVFKGQMDLESLEFYSADVSSLSEVKKFYESIINSYPMVCGLVNVAGVQNPIGVFDECNSQDWLNNISINLIGTANMCRGAIKIFKQNGLGKIINFSGGGATSSRPNFSAYAVSKTAIVRFTEVIAEELSKYNIDINSVAPGAINTRMLEEVINAGADAGKENELAIKRKQSGGDPINNIVDLCKFLISENSDGISGKLISAIWDDYRSESFLKRIRKDLDFCSLRRVDGKNFESAK